jgi:ATP-dependent RNA helicase DeaD
MISESQRPDPTEASADPPEESMTNDTELHQNGVADDAPALGNVSQSASGSDTGETTEPASAELVPSAELAPPPAPEPTEPTEPVEPAPPSFDDLGLHPDVRLALDEMGYFAPTAVQTAVYKPVSEGKDLLVQSRTGTGKTTAFGLPTISKIIPTHRAPQALILAPTRELALQVSRELTNLSKHRGIIVEPIYGGAPIGKQITALRNGVHIVVGTPGRVLDHIGRRTLDCSTVQTFILDECDEMLSMGFLEDIERVVSYLPDKKQTLLFSATMPDEVTRYARRHMRAPEQISLSRDGVSVNEIHHAYYIVSGIARSRDLLKILFAENPESAIIFCNTRDETTMVARFLQKQGLDAEPLSSDLSQSDRERVMGRMKAHSLRLLCATDVAARGIDISNLSHVINYSVPESPEIYVHRTGRTGRAGKTGTALSLVGPRELGNFRYVRLQFGIKPEERLLPKDTIFEGRLKVPLPPIGLPQPPDPVQILIRGTPLIGTGPSDLEMKIFEKLLATSAGKKVIAQLVSERLNQLSTRSKPKRVDRPERSSERSDRDGADSSAGIATDDRGDRSRDRPDRGERSRDGDRPWRDREDRGERRFDRDRPRGDGDRPRGDGDRPRGDGDRPRSDGDRPRSDSDRPRSDGDRPWRDRDDSRGRDRYGRDRGDRPDRDRPRDRFETRAETIPTSVGPGESPVTLPAEGSAPGIVLDARSDTEPRGDRDRDRRDRPDRDRDRGERRFDRPRDRGDRGDRPREDRPRDDRPRDDRPRDDRRTERFDRNAVDQVIRQVESSAEPVAALPGSTTSRAPCSIAPIIAIATAATGASQSGTRSRSRPPIPASSGRPGPRRNRPAPPSPRRSSRCEMPHLPSRPTHLASGAAVTAIAAANAASAIPSRIARRSQRRPSRTTSRSEPRAPGATPPSSRRPRRRRPPRRMARRPGCS